MPAPVVAELLATVTETVGVVESATVFINGLAERIRLAIEAALAEGATKEELEPFVQLETDLEAKTDELAAAIAANP